MKLTRKDKIKIQGIVKNCMKQEGIKDLKCKVSKTGKITFQNK